MCNMEKTSSMVCFLMHECDFLIVIKGKIRYNNGE